MAAKPVGRLLVCSVENVVPPSPAECRIVYCFVTWLPGANEVSTLPASVAVPVTLARLAEVGLSCTR